MDDHSYHSGSRPQDSLKGGMEMPHIQAPMTSENQVNPRSAAADNVGQTWNSSSEAPTPGMSGSNDKNKAH